MARKPAKPTTAAPEGDQAKPVANANPAPDQGGVSATGQPVPDAAGDQDDRGTSTAGASPDAPDTAGPPVAPGGAGDGADDGIVAPTHTISGDDEDAPAYLVICHRDGGRRRGGRRWPHGQTSVREGELTEYELAQLMGDPQFTIAPFEKG